MEKVIVVGGGVAGSELGTYLGQKTQKPLEVLTIEREPDREFGGWAFQSFPPGVSTNLAMRKMYLGRDPEDIFRWSKELTEKGELPEGFEFDPNKPVPRVLIQQYVRWRREQVQNVLATYSSVTGEAVKVIPGSDGISVALKSGETISGDHLVMASGSISVKVLPFLEHLQDHERVIIDPLTREGYERREQIDTDARVLIVGMGLTGEEQAQQLLNRGLTNLTLLSRNKFRHFVYGEQQTNKPLVLAGPPDFFKADTDEEFTAQHRAFFEGYVAQGHSPEDIIAAIRPFWEEIRRKFMGGCVKAARRLDLLQRPMAIYSIGTSFEISEQLNAAEKSGHLRLAKGHIASIEDKGDYFVVTLEDGSQMECDHIINAVGRNIIRHPIWETLLAEGVALKHAGIGVQVNEQGQMLNAQGVPWSNIWVVGMARAGDHSLRHGYLGNTAFNVPQVRAHVYNTMDALLESINTGFVR